MVIVINSHGTVIFCKREPLGSLLLWNQDLFGCSLALDKSRGCHFLCERYTFFVRHQVSKDIVVAVLITDTEGKVLIVEPIHKDGWIFPGGHVEVGEAPSSACIREAAAEIGVTIERPVRLLSIDYRGHTDEYVMFIFDGGVCTNEMLQNLKLSPNLSAHRFVTPEQAVTLLRKNSARRLMPTLAARERTGIAYLEDQEPF